MSLRLLHNEDRLTRIDQLLLRDFPALVTLNLGLELANLDAMLGRCDALHRCGFSAYRFRRLGLDDELILLEILRNCELYAAREAMVTVYLERDLHVGG